MKTLNGFTLLELIATISISSILMSIALPSFDNLKSRSEIKAQVQNLQATLRLGRQTAIQNNQKTTLCPTSDGKSCSNDWSQGYMLFIDLNADRNLNHDDSILNLQLNTNENITLNWKAFGYKNSFQWHHTGITNHQNGLFSFCYNNKPKQTRALIVSKSGRVRHSKDSNGNEIHENASRNDLVC